MKIKIIYVNETQEDIDDCIGVTWLESCECYYICYVGGSLKLDVHSVRKIEINE